MMKPAYDVVIIGSGFGGSIPAMRLARAQQAAGSPSRSACWRGASATTAANFRAISGRPKDWFWRKEGENGWRGLIDFRDFHNISVACGSGVGGTSLVYLDVQIEAFDSDFTDRREGGESALAGIGEGLEAGACALLPQ